MNDHKSLLITGGNGKLGRVLVAHFLAQNYTVLVTSRRQDSVNTLLHAHEAYVAAQRLKGWHGDLTDPGQIRRLLDFVARSGIPFDGLINNARNTAFLRIEADGRVAREQFVGEMVLDVIVPYELTIGLAGLSNQRLKRVINVASMYGIVAANPTLYDNPQQQSPIHYSVAKASIIHLTRELAIRLASRGICVNSVSFGGFEGRVDDAFRERYARLCPLGRMLRDDEVIGPVDFLLSDGASGVTGHNLVADGGWSVW